MVKSRVLLFFFLLLPALGQAQGKVDSLQNLLSRTTSDSLRILLMIEINGAIEFQDIDKSKEYLDEAAQLAETNDWDWARLKVYRAQSFAAVLVGDYSSSLRFDNQRLSLAAAAKDTAQIQDALNYIGDTYQSLGEYDEAYFYFTKAYKLAQI